MPPEDNPKDDQEAEREAYEAWEREAYSHMEREADISAEYRKDAFE